MLVVLHVELRSRLFRLIFLFKVRDGAFDPTILEFAVNDAGITVGKPFSAAPPSCASRSSLLPGCGWSGPSLTLRSRGIETLLPRALILRRNLRRYTERARRGRRVQLDGAVGQPPIRETDTRIKRKLRK